MKKMNDKRKFERKKLFNKKAFTLIELLAIIVILAIIAVITVPIILNIIENSKKGAATDSAYGYKEAIEKYYTAELFNNDNLKLDNEYTVVNGVLNGTGFSNVEIPLSGTKPSSGKLHYTNNVLDDGCLVIGDYRVTFNSDSSINETVKGNCDDYVINGSGPASFTTDSWATIKAKLIENRDAYEIGSEKIVRMNLEGTEKDYKLRLANTSPCSESTAQSKTSCGVVIEFVTTIGEQAMNETDTNAGGWYASQMRSYLNSGNDSIYSKLNAVIGKDSSNNDIIISTTPVISGAGKNQTSDPAEDYLYILSPREVGISVNYDNINDATYTNILSYYNTNNSDSARIKYDKVNDGTVKTWWLRSAANGTAQGFCSVYTNGHISNYTASNSYSIAPAFRILD